MKFLSTIVLASAIGLLPACEKLNDHSNNPIVYGQTYLKIDITTDKAVYEPNSTVHFSLKEMPSGNYKIRYMHLGEVLKEENLTSTSWQWTVPQDDFKGYLVEIYNINNGVETTYGSIAVDVSSDWKTFPRYGFLSSYGDISQSKIEENIDFLTRCHINGLQFYDWLYEHHRPLAGTVAAPLAQWPDLMNRTNYLSTVKNYIEAAKQKRMKTMFYNLAFGALKNASSDGVQEAWYLFKDKQKTEKDKHDLNDDIFRSDIFLVNPANTSWQTYLSSRNADVYSVLDFDGYHIDQLGSRGTLYDFSGNEVSLSDTYAPFINAMKQAHPDKKLVMNAVSQYGQANIASTEVDFLYSELWDETKSFEQLAKVILDNDQYSNHQKKTVLAAYMNYAKSSTAGYVNESGILLANSVIFSFGGAHLELGEHYLANEYFPNENLQMKASLKKNLISYYDFLVAYQNLLRDGGEFIQKEVQAVENLNLSAWPPSQGNVAYNVKKVDNKEVIHFINFSNANSLEWRDTNGTQVEPTTISAAKVKIAASNPKKVWFASPDVSGGAPRELSFEKQDNDIIVTLPSVKYWDMLVIEY